MSYFKLLGLSAVLLSACASNPYSPMQAKSDAAENSFRYVDEAQRNASILAADNRKERDRRAILAMQGEYQVSFHFQETVPLSSGYEKQQKKDSGAFETVLVLEDRGDFISLQHILVTEGGHVVKHWRQDWSYEAPARWEFTDDQTWTMQTLAVEKRKHSWTQCVYEVSDAPRYCGTGRWNHKYGSPTWTSDRSWRPLPRREYTKRSDYNALNVENRHTITAQGWTHEQDNSKVVRSADDANKTLVREFGYNEYRRIDGYDFSPAYAYWEKTRDYWKLVRKEWTQRIDKHRGIRLNTTVDGMSIIGPVFRQAAQVEQGEAVPMDEFMALLDEWTTAP